MHSRGEVTQKRASQKERLFFIDCIPYIGRLGRAFQFILFSCVGLYYLKINVLLIYLRDDDDSNIPIMAPKATAATVSTRGRSSNEPIDAEEEDLSPSSSSSLAFKIFSA